MSPEERAARREQDKKRDNFLWLLNSTGKDLDMRVKLAATLLALPPTELRNLMNEARTTELEAAREKPLAVEIVVHARQCPEGDSEIRYDPNYGYRQVLLEVARRFEVGQAQFAGKVPLPQQRRLAAWIAESIVSEESAFDLIEELSQDAEEDPDVLLTPTSLGLLSGLHRLDDAKSAASEETIGILLIKYESQRDAASDDTELTAILARAVFLLADTMMPGSAGEAPEDPYSAPSVAKARIIKAEAPRIITGDEPELSPEAELVEKPRLITGEEDDALPAPKAAPKPAPKAAPRSLTPGEVVKLLNVHDARVDAGAVLEKIPMEGFKKDAFTLQFLKKAQEEDGTALRHKLLVYAIEGFHSDSRSRFKKSVFLARKLVPEVAELEDADDEDELTALCKDSLGDSQLETLDFLFDKKLGSLQERTERAQPFLETIMLRPASLGGFLRGLNRRLAEKPAGFRDPGIQTLVRLMAAQSPSFSSADKAVVGEIKKKVWDAFNRADEGSLKFPSERAKAYFVECGESLLDALG